MKKTMFKISTLALPLVALALLGVSAHAQNNQPSTTEPQNTEELKPVRQTTGRMVLNKLTYLRDPGGGYSFLVSQVCDKSFNVDVYDGRGKPATSWQVPKVVSCDSEVLGKKVIVSGTGAIVVRTQGVFPGDKPSDVRSNTFGLYLVDEDGTTRYRPLSSADVWSRDIGASAILSLGESTTWDCDAKGICGPGETEIFYATVEFGQ